MHLTNTIAFFLNVNEMSMNPDIPINISFYLITALTDAVICLQLKLAISVAITYARNIQAQAICVWLQATPGAGCTKPQHIDKYGNSLISRRYVSTPQVSVTHLHTTLFPARYKPMPIPPGRVTCQHG